MAQTISLCMLTHDSEKSIIDSLNSARGLVNEIIIVDLGSTDSTKSLAKKFGEENKENKIKTKIIEFKFNDDYSAARNEGIKNSSCDWIFMLNPDEILDSKSRGIILTAISQGYADAVSVIKRVYTNFPEIGFMQLEDYFGQLSSDIKEKSKTFAGFYQFDTIRIFRAKEYKFSHRVFESISESLAEKGGIVAKTHITLHCFPAEKTAEELKARKTRELALIKKDIKDFSGNPKLMFEAGKLLQELGEDDKALEYYEKTIRLDSSEKTGSKENNAVNAVGKSTFLYFRAGLVYLKKQDVKDIKKAEELFQKSIELNPTLRAPYVILAKMFIQDNRHKEALKILDKALENKIGDIEIYNIIGFLLMQAEKPKEAMAVLEEAKRLCERNIKLKSELKRTPVFEMQAVELISNNLYTAYLLLGKGDEAIDFLEREIKTYPGIASFQLNLINLLSKTEQHEKALKYCKKALELQLDNQTKDNLNLLINNIHKISDKK